jgi:predicted PurR-regulated permease PerM
MVSRFKNWISGFRLSLRMKMILSLSAIVVVLVLSSVISILEYRRMSNYVSDLIAEDINSINVAQQLANVTDNYNLQILTLIGDESVSSLPDFDQQEFVFYCDSLRSSFTGKKMLPLTDSVLYSYSAYMLTSLELENVIQSDFIDSRTWYFDRLQPSFHRLRGYIDDLSEAMYDDLQQNSEEFDQGFYRSIVPGIVAVGVGVMLVLLLMFFITSYYVSPLNKMLKGLDEYRSMGRRYNYTFEGDDQLSELNDGITELTEENRQYRRRIKQLKDNQSRTGSEG